MDISNLNSLKVADLKQLLKTRGLSIVGNKSELIQRLDSAMLSDPAGGDAVEKNGKLIDKEIDEDAILGDDDGSFSKPDESLIHNEELLLSETSIDVAVNIPQNSTLSKTQAMASNSIPVTQNSSQSDKQSTITSVSSLKQLAGSKNACSLDQRKQMRLQKFADPKLKNRVERFGISKPLTENDKLKQRMNRFGEAVSEKAKTIDEKERVEKRKERFGMVGSNDNVRKPISNVNVPEKIQKRQERFGLVEATASNKDNKILPGFKRRRFAF